MNAGLLRVALVVTKRHYHTDRLVATVFGKRRDVSRVVTIVKVVVETISAWFFIKNFPK